MENKKILNEEQLETVAGGTISDLPRQLFSVGDKVTLFVYPDFGVGVITAAQLVSGNWQYVAQFGDNTITADQSEFLPAQVN